MFEVAKISKIAQKYKIVSFDIFDTLIKRDVGNPTYIFKYVQMEYNLRHPEATVNNFQEKRIAGERNAREKKYPLEVTLKEIYSFCEVPNPDELMSIEEEVELSLCFPNVPVIEQYNKCILNGQRVVLTSDMYLPVETIERMLEKCGIKGYEKMYLSSLIGEKKKTGKLFRYLIQDLQVKSKDVLHIGDSKITDNIMPRRIGMGSFYVNRYLLNTEFITREDIIKSDCTLYPFINNRLPLYNNRSSAFRWGYETFGPLLLGFCEWIHKKVEENHSQKIYFLARDMNLIRQVYEKYYSDKGVVYLEVSRRSLRRSYVKKRGEILSVLDTMKRRAYTMQYLLSILGVSTKKILELEQKYNLSEKFDLNSRRLKWLSSLDKDVMEILNDEADYADEYLRQNDLFNGETALIVDIGWHGTIQNMLETIVGKPFKGLYFGITKRSYFKKMDMEGYWFSLDNEEDSYHHISLISLLETMLFAQIGTTIGYKKENGRVIPIYNKPEQSDFSFVGDFQSGGLQFIEDYTTRFGKEVTVEAEYAVKGFTRMAFSPEMSHVKVIGNLPYEEERIYHLVEKRDKYKYLLNPKLLITDYDNSRWKTGYIKWLFPFLSHPNRLEVLIRSRKKLLHGLIKRLCNLNRNR